MQSSQKMNKGIEITRWKVGDADEFQSLDNRQDADIEPAPPDSYDTDYADEQNININPSMTPEINKELL